MAELNTNTNEEPNLLPPKRKQPVGNLDFSAAEDAAKKLRPAAAEDKLTEKNGAKNEHEDNEHEAEEEEEEEDYEGEDELDSDDEEDDDDDVENGGVVDRKGKGIMKDDKGKGKMIEDEDDSDDDDDDDDDVSLSDDDDDDISDDPLAEVDLENILPSRTRGRTVTPGVRFSKDNDNADA